MKVQVVSIPVVDQDSAEKFYTEKLGFTVKVNIPLGEGNRWLTVVHPDHKDGPEVLLEPAPKHFKPSATYQEELFKAGIPCFQFEVENIHESFKNLSSKEVEFKMEPTDIGSAYMAIFNDTCGNLIQLLQMK
ncbi:VOC family protein [Luteibaculum oceani]|uniref:VOC family protein n=1 Tax=Luteibaculum oceani TaxID=1294296 RepID=A0A5C6V022_9FLAO|nr:VOC family protein [Luteibaculum oceani]TXC76265.1 VOC family protein [Luteibaculum oceani]